MLLCSADLTDMGLNANWEVAAVVDAADRRQVADQVEAIAAQTENCGASRAKGFESRGSTGGWSRSGRSACSLGRRWVVVEVQIDAFFPMNSGAGWAAGRVAAWVSTRH